MKISVIIGSIAFMFILGMSILSNQVKDSANGPKSFIKITNWKKTPEGFKLDILLKTNQPQKVNHFATCKMYDENKVEVGVESERYKKFVKKTAITDQIQFNTSVKFKYLDCAFENEI